MAARASTTNSSSGGKTSVTLSSSLVNALTTLGVQASGFGETQILNGVASFPITGGEAQLSNNGVDILHNGGLTLKRGNTTVNLTDFEISNLNSGTTLTGLVTVNGTLAGRVSLFSLQPGSVNATSQSGVTTLNLNNVSTTLTSQAATALNVAFGVSAFQSGLNIGTAQVNAPVNAASGSIIGITPPSIQTEPSGVTTVAFSSGLVSALNTLGVQITGFDGTQIRNGVADFEITGGAADLKNTQVEIAHGGGLSFRTSSTGVTLSDFAISNLNNSPVLTGLVRVNGNLVTRAPLFDLQLNGVTTPATGRTNLTNLNLQNVGVTLRSEAATVLNQAFNVSAFQSGFNIGTAQVNAFVNTATGDVEGTNPLRVINATGRNQLIFAGADSATINATNSLGGNRIYGGASDDVVLLGANDRVFGGAGNDRFYTGTGGGNQITGGAGADQFWIVNNGQIPASANRITDFRRGTDVIGLEGLVTRFSQLQFRQNGDNTVILANGRRLAVLENFRARLSASDFAIVGLGQSGEPDNLTNVVAKSAPTFTRNDRNTIEVTGRNQQITGTNRNDLIDASQDRGGNRIFAERLNDTIVVGQNDRAFGDRGNDRFFVQSGGNNRLTGGLGVNQFWIANGQYPDSVNFITDFRSGRDVIGISGLGVSSFSQVGLTQQGSSTLISVNGNDLAILRNISPNQLSASNFAFA
jgi:hypothetical protein